VPLARGQNRRSFDRFRSTAGGKTAYPACPALSAEREFQALSPACYLSISLPIIWLARANRQAKGGYFPLGPRFCRICSYNALDLYRSPMVPTLMLRFVPPPSFGLRLTVILLPSAPLAATLA